MKLNDVAIRKAKPEAKPYRIADGGGMYLEVTPTGSKYWRLAYRYGGKQKVLALGVYPDVPLTLARERRDEARKLLAQDIHPGEQMKAAKAAGAEKAANSFEVVAREWFAKYGKTLVASHADRIIRRFGKEIFTWIGSKPIADLTAPELLSVVRRIESRGALETAHRACKTAGRCCGAMLWQREGL
jgi:hypothetical protein